MAFVNVVLKNQQKPQLLRLKPQQKLLQKQKAKLQPNKRRNTRRKAGPDGFRFFVAVYPMYIPKIITYE